MANETEDPSASVPTASPLLAPGSLSLQDMESQPISAFDPRLLELSGDVREVAPEEAAAGLHKIAALIGAESGLLRAQISRMDNLHIDSNAIRVRRTRRREDGDLYSLRTVHL
jgi:hypothetical protein